jgi:hypothetical protein
MEIREIYDIAARLNLSLKLFFSFDVILRDPASRGYQLVCYFIRFLGNMHRQVWKDNLETNKNLI